MKSYPSVTVSHENGWIVFVEKKMFIVVQTRFLRKKKLKFPENLGKPTFSKSFLYIIGSMTTYYNYTVTVTN